MKKMIRMMLVCLVVLGTYGCSQKNEETDENVFEVGICNYVDDASLNQIVDNIRNQLEALGKENGMEFRIDYQNCNADAGIMNQIISDFIAEDKDLMVAVATPVAMGMQAATEEKKIPVIFAAVSDPLGAGLVDSLDNPGDNLSGTSDFLDTSAVLNLILALNPEIKKVGLLYDAGQDASLLPVTDAKKILSEKGIEVIEKCGTNVTEIQLAVQTLIQENVEAVFTPTDNTVMEAQLTIYEDLIEAGIPHFTGADSFALNGAFLGYGVDYANLGKVTADMIFEVLVRGQDISTMPVRTFDNGTATINTETCELLGYDYEEIAERFAPLCTRVQPILTAESFD
ncbi:MAG: ABC transporter substrate-binding protein [Erysipelotrichaceae bacterium]|nr:ABC transporter substrate-binding protein [Erysipelotrichaceae bacterium]